MEKHKIAQRLADGHPGEDLETFFDSLKLRQQHIAADLGVSRFTVNQILNSRRAVTPEMALRLEYVFWIDAQDLVERQARHDLARLRMDTPIEIDLLRPSGTQQS